MNFKLDYDIYSAEDRKTYIAKHDLSELTPKELELCANYILFGKGEDGKSAVDKGEIEIQTKFSTYSKNRHKVISLDALLEQPTFDESQLTKNPVVFKRVRYTIDRTDPKIQAVPGMKDLWRDIDAIDKQIQEATHSLEVSQSERDLYLLRHLVV